MFRVICLLLIATNGGFAQRLSVGVVAGASPTEAFKDTTYPGPSPQVHGDRHYSESKDYLIGAALELHFNPRWSLEVDGLFRQLHLTSAVVAADGALSRISPGPVVTWQFPFLAKYRISSGRLRPFIEGGPSLRTAGNLNGFNPSHYGGTVGAGIAWRWRSVNIAPTVRFTRWGEDSVNCRPRSAQNQLELLASFSSDTASDWRLPRCSARHES